MSNFVLSKAMGDIPDDLLQEAMDVRKRSSVGWMIFRAAACLAVVIGLIAASWGLRLSTDDIVAAPGILTVTAYAADQIPITMTAPDAVRHGKFAIVSPLLGNPFCNALTLSVPDAHGDGTDIRFSLSFEGVVFRVAGELDNIVSEEVSVDNHATVYWTMEEAVTEPGTVEHRTTAYADILVYDGEKIIGYAVLRLQEMTCAELAKAEGREVAHDDTWLEVDPKDFVYCDGGDHMTGTYSIEMLASVYFPKVDGEYQHITEEYVIAIIEEVKKK